MNLVNMVWVERGILLMILYMIIKNFSYLIKKSIVIKNKKLRRFMEKLFYSLSFSKDPEKDKKNNFYFNTRMIMKKKDIIIDYLNNYDDYIPAEKIWLVPYYDMNDPLIFFQYSSKNKLDANEQREIIKKFSNKKRSNFYNRSVNWDIYFENKVIQKAKEFGLVNISDKINNFLTSTYTDTTGPKNYFTNIINPTLDYQNNKSNTSSNLFNTFATKVKNLEENKIKLNLNELDKKEFKINQVENKQIKSKDVKRQTQKVKEETKISESLKEETKMSESLEEEKTLKNKNIDTNKNMIQLVNLINEKLENINKINEIMYNKKLKTKV